MKGVITMTNIEKFVDMVKNSDNIVFFGGAGVSTESGIPDFRSTDGLYNQHYKYPPETILSHSFFMDNTEEFYRFYRDKMLALDAQPNMAHIKLAELEKAGKLKAIVTQNIDGLHQKAGSKNVLELHGSVHRNFCMHCNKFFDAEYMKNSTGIPKCDACGGTIKPDVVLYEEGLDNDVIEQSLYYISHADMLIIGGTSLVVYPAAGLVRYYRGIKKERTVIMYAGFMEEFYTAYMSHLKLIEGREYERNYGPLFLNKRGMAMTYDLYRKRLNKLVKTYLVPELMESDTPELQALGMKLLTNQLAPHIFRHYFTVRLVLSGRTKTEIAGYRGDADEKSAEAYLKNKGALVAKAYEGHALAIEAMKKEGMLHVTVE